MEIGHLELLVTAPIYPGTLLHFRLYAAEHMQKGCL